MGNVCRRIAEVSSGHLASQSSHPRRDKRKSEERPEQNYDHYFVERTGPVRLFRSTWIQSVTHLGQNLHVVILGTPASAHA